MIRMADLIYVATGGDAWQVVQLMYQLVRALLGTMISHGNARSVVLLCEIILKVDC
jgi:hypothetical protein